MVRSKSVLRSVVLKTRVHSSLDIGKALPKGTGHQIVLRKSVSRVSASLGSLLKVTSRKGYLGTRLDSLPPSCFYSSKAKYIP